MDPHRTRRAGSRLEPPADRDDPPLEPKLGCTTRRAAAGLTPTTAIEEPEREKDREREQAPRKAKKQAKQSEKDPKKDRKKLKDKID